MSMLRSCQGLARPKRANWKYGLYSSEAKLARKRLQQLLREYRQQCRDITESCRWRRKPKRERSSNDSSTANGLAPDVFDSLRQEKQSGDNFHDKDFVTRAIARW